MSSAAYRLRMPSATFVRCLQFLRMHPRLSRDRHEIRIAEPARQGMQVQVSSNARPRRFSQVHSQVHSVGLVIPAERIFHALRQFHHFLQRSPPRTDSIPPRAHTARSSRARGVRKPVQNHEHLFAAMDDQCFFVPSSIDRVAENTLRLLPLTDLRHVLESPGRPKIIHRLRSPLASPRTQHNPRALLLPESSASAAKKNAPIARGADNLRL